MMLYKKIIKLIPGAKTMYIILRHFYAAIFLAGDKYTCPICERSFRKFFSAGIIQRENAICPYCGAAERTRLEFLFLQQYTTIFTDKIKVLHFAPESALTSRLLENQNIEYTSGDLQKGRAMCVVNICNIQYSDAEFDYVICNHVLEHVPADKKALAEIMRILKPGGKAVITVPIAINSVTTLEQQTFSDKERLELYGQSDHVRIYGADFPVRLQKAGFEVETYSAGTDVSVEVVSGCALITGETVYIGTKPF